MKTRLFMIITVVLLLFTCRGPNKPKGIEFAWSPDGKYLAMVQINSLELLLIETDDNQVKQVTRIDTIVKSMAPQWSHDGKYLLYFKMDQKAIYNYSMTSGRSKRLIKYIDTPESFFNRDYFTFWSPKVDHFVYLSQSGNNNWSMNTISAEGSDNKVLLRSKSEPLSIQWSKDGQWLYYILNDSENDGNQGVWAVRADGKTKKQVIKNQNIVAIQQSPDGNYWAYIKKSGKDKEYYQLVISNADFQSVHRFYLATNELEQLDWSPDSKQIICVEKKDDRNHNLWLAGFDTKTLLKVTFDNLENYFGWRDSEHFAYTIKYPEQLVPLNQEEDDNQEIMKLLTGQVNLNHYFISNNRHKDLHGYNIFADTYYPTGDKRAYYIAYRDETKMLEDNEIYLPVITFSDKDSHYLIRTPKEEVNMMLIYYQNGKYELAKDSIIRYWKQKYQIDEIPDFSNLQVLLDRRKSEKNKTIAEILKEEYEIILGMVLVHRRMNENTIANYLMEQIGNLAMEDSSWNDIDDFFAFTNISIYIKYNALEEGLRDMELMLSWRPSDSLYCANIYFSQAHILDVMHDRKGLKEALRKGISIFPEEVDLDNQYVLGMIAERYKNDREIVSVIIPLLNRLLQKEDLDGEVGQLLAEMYLTHGDKENAYLAYQKAVSDGFDQYNLWQALFDLKY